MAQNDFENKRDTADQKIDLRLWKRLIAYAMRHRRTVVSVMLVLLVVAGIDLAYPQLSRYAIDHFIEGGTTEGLWLYGLVYAALVVVQSLGVFLFVRGAGRLEMDMSYDIRQDAFAKLQQLSFSFYDTTSVGWLMARMVSDIARLSDMIAWSLVDLMWAGVFAVGIVVVLLAMNWKLGLLVLCITPVLAALCVFFQKRILKYQRAVRKTNSRITGAFNEGIMGAMTTKTLVREEASAAEFRELTGAMRTASIRSALLSALFMPLVMALGSISTALALSRGGSLVFAGAMGFGTLAAFISYTTQLFDPIQQLARILAEMQSAQASAERVIDLLDTQPDIVDSPEVEAEYGTAFAPRRGNWPPIAGGVEFRDVTFAYKNRRDRAARFQFKGTSRARPSPWWARRARAKAPSSTWCAVFTSRPRARCSSTAWTTVSAASSGCTPALGYVLQTPHLFSGSIADNIRYGRKDATLDEVKRAAAMVRADRFIEALPDGYGTEVGEGGGRLSTGQKQLVCFARVVLSDPRIFVLDEATSSIDTETEQLIQNAIQTVLTGRTSFIVAHRLSTIRSADKILVIRGGRITEAGTHDELLALGGYYYSLYTHQYRAEATRNAFEA